MTRKLAEIIAGNIKNARAALDLSQAALAERAQISTGHLAMIELCNRVPSIDSLETLAHALGLEVYELLKPAETPGEEHSVSSYYSIKASLNKDLTDIFRKYLPAIHESGD